jgi:hypothetical protein
MKLICINNENNTLDITIGEIYDDCEDHAGAWFLQDNIIGRGKVHYDKSYFMPITEYRKETLKILLK